MAKSSKKPRKKNQAADLIGRTMNVYLTAELVDLIDDLCEEQDRSRSWMVENMLRRSLIIKQACQSRDIALPPRLAAH